MTTITGLHHVTAICGSAQDNVDFFVGVVGQKLVKRTVNFDDPGTYHLYYGNPSGEPGSILTFFPFSGAKPGRAGQGMASAFAYAVPSSDLDQLVGTATDACGRTARWSERFGERVATLRDPDGGAVEFIATANAADAHGFHSVTLWERDPDRTLRLLTDVFGYSHVAQESKEGFDRHRLAVPGEARGRIVDVVRSHVPTAGVPGAGTIHHVAFRARTAGEQHHWMEALSSAGHRTTPVIDRNYFESVYFREPGGVLFEIATDPPGFAVDEPEDNLGKRLMLPQQYERIRDQIEKVLPPLKVPA